MAPNYYHQNNNYYYCFHNSRFVYCTDKIFVIIHLLSKLSAASKIWHFFVFNMLLGFLTINAFFCGTFKKDELKKKNS